MINIKAEKECVLELIKENRPIVELNLKMAKKHINIKCIKKASKKKVAENSFNFFDVFMEEAYKQLRLDGASLAKEKIELTSEPNIEESTKDENDIKIKSESIISSEYNKKINSTTKNQSNLFNKNKVSKNDNLNDEDSLKSICDINKKSKEDIICKPKALECPPCTNSSVNTELISPFTEVKRKDGSSQLGFSFSMTKTPIEKTKTKTHKKKDIHETVSNNSVSQLSIFSLI